MTFARVGVVPGQIWRAGCTHPTHRGEIVSGLRKGFTKRPDHQAHRRQRHACPAHQADDRRHCRVVVEDSQRPKNCVPIVNCKFWISNRYQWQAHGSCVGHIRCDTQQVFEEKEDAEGESRSLPLYEEIACPPHRPMKLPNQPNRACPPSWTTRFTLSMSNPSPCCEAAYATNSA